MTSKLVKYKPIFRRLKISHNIVGNFTGLARESVTCILLGRKVPNKKEAHLLKEFEELSFLVSSTLGNKPKKKAVDHLLSIYK